jgi:transglutaminase superfamily protein
MVTESRAVIREQPSITTAAPVSRSVARPEFRAPPGSLACAAVLVIVTLGLRLGGLRSTKAITRWLIARGRSGARAERTCIPLVVHRVDLAAAFFPGRARCLERSLALHVCLGWCGFQTTVRLGVQPYPFTAHAWVELGGEPVGDSQDSVALFCPLPLDDV